MITSALSCWTNHRTTCQTVERQYPKEIAARPTYHCKQRVSHSHFCPHHSSKRKKKKQIDEETKPARYLLRKPTLHGELSWMSVIVQLRSPCRYHLSSLERTNEGLSDTFVEKGVQQAKWPIIKDATEQKKKKNVANRGRERKMRKGGERGVSKSRCQSREYFWTIVGGSTREK